MRSYWSNVGPNPIWQGSLPEMEKNHRSTDTWRVFHVITKAGIRVMSPQTKDL